MEKSYIKEQAENEKRPWISGSSEYDRNNIDKWCVNTSDNIYNKRTNKYYLSYVGWLQTKTDIGQ